MSRRWLVLALSTLYLQQASAHQVDAVALDFEPTEELWKFTGIMDLTFMMPETRNDPDAEVIRRWTVMNEATPAEQERMRMEMEMVLRRCLVLREEGHLLQLDFEFPDFHDTPLVLVEDPEDWALFRVRIQARRSQNVPLVNVEWLDETGASLLVQREGLGEWLVYEIRAGESLDLSFEPEPLEDEPVFAQDPPATELLGDLDSEEDGSTLWFVGMFAAIAGGLVFYYTGRRIVSRRGQ